MTKPYYSGMEIVPDEVYNLAVYGTLKQGYYNHDTYLRGYVKIGNLYGRGIMLHLGAYPMVVRQSVLYPLKKDDFITCELYRVRGTDLLKIDGLEGHPDFYERQACWNNQHGWYWMYYGHAHKYMRGVRDVIYDGTWLGDTTPSVQVDFLDGTKKPHFRASAGKQLPIQVLADQAVVIPSSGKDHTSKEVVVDATVVEKKEEELSGECEIEQSEDEWKGGDAIIEVI